MLNVFRRGGLAPPDSTFEGQTQDVCLTIYARMEQAEWLLRSISQSGPLPAETQRCVHQTARGHTDTPNGQSP